MIEIKESKIRDDAVVASKIPRDDLVYRGPRLYPTLKEEQERKAFRKKFKAFRKKFKKC